MRVSVTTIDQFRRWSDPEQEYIDEGELIATIKGIFIPTPNILLGQAFGRCLEKGGKYLQGDGRYHVPVRFNDEWLVYQFAMDVMAPAFERFDRRGVFEVKGTKEYSGITVVTKADQIIGTKIVENKTTLSSQFDFDKYQASYQWRYELDIFTGATSLEYNVFLLTDDNGEFGIRSIEHFDLFPYPALHDECQEMLDKFAAYVKRRHLEEYLQDRVTA